VNTYNCRIWGIENPHEYTECDGDSPKLDVFCTISMSKVYGPFFSWRGTLLVLFIETCCRIVFSHSLTKIINKEAYYSSKMVLLLIYVEKYAYISAHVFISGG
jgi:hypothetical protein